MKLLVTTDFSKNSKVALRFALALAKQSVNIEVVLYHGIYFLKPINWSEDFFDDYKIDEIDRLTFELQKFVNSVIGKDKSKFSSLQYVVERCISTEKDIINYAEENSIDYICIATQGAGLLRKIMGTHTSYIVNNSKVPVMVIPSNYRSKAIEKVTYLSDFENLKSEFLKISKLSKEISFKTEVLHFLPFDYDKEKFNKIKALFSTQDFENAKLNVQKNNTEILLINKVAKFVQKYKPEMLIMFTKRNKGFFESIFRPSKSAELTFSTNVPVVIFPK